MKKMLYDQKSNPIPFTCEKYTKIVLILKHLKLDAYLRSLGLSVGKKLCFFLLCLHVPKLFCAVIGLSCNRFLSWYA